MAATEKFRASFVGSTTYSFNPTSHFLLRYYHQRRNRLSYGSILSQYSRKRRMQMRDKAMVTSVIASTNERLSHVVKENSTILTYNVAAVVSVKKKTTTASLKDKVLQFFDTSSTDATDQYVVLQLVSTEIDPQTMEPKLSSKAVLDWSKSPKVGTHSYKVEFTVDSDFGMPGAITLSNNYLEEFFLETISIEELLNFTCNSWIQPTNVNPESRVFFTDKAYLPQQTPKGLKELRDKALRELKGSGDGKRLSSDRIYDYDIYNDIGDPDRGIEFARPTFGGDQKNPHPRRCRTGRPPTSTDMNAESPASASISAYVPRDEAFEESKDADISKRKLLGTIRNIIPSLLGIIYNKKDVYKVNDYGNLYKIQQPQLGSRDKLLNRLSVKEILIKMQDSIEKLFKFDPPKISKDVFWGLRNDEFGQRVLAGMNPLNIEKLEVFPPVSKLDPSVYGPQESALQDEHIIGHLDGMSVKQVKPKKALEESKLFILDYHDTYIPFLDRINALEGRKSYATRTLFFLTCIGTLKPIAIELRLPLSGKQTALEKHVLTPPIDATTYWLWQLGKAHVSSNDARVHQLVNHWLRTHACLEPFIIAAHRQLSVMHPIFKLLHPHMRYTLKINAMARETLINAGGTIESIFAPGQYCMEIACSAYRDLWRFDLEGLPADLIRRGMAEADPTQPHGLRLMIEDYPYANDGLFIWSAIEKLVQTYVKYYYKQEVDIQNDMELQTWYSESINVGHADLSNATWWPKLSTPDDLINIHTTIIWIATAQHASLNFGQYSYGGYVPNRPPSMRLLLPHNQDPEYADFLANPREYFLSSLPSLSEAAAFIAVLDIISAHSPDEEYIGQRQDLSSWSADPEIMEAFYRFYTEIKTIEKEIEKRNCDPRLRNRCGPGTSPYELLIPSSKPGVTCRGVPNSITI